MARTKIASNGNRSKDAAWYLVRAAPANRSAKQQTPPNVESIERAEQRQKDGNGPEREHVIGRDREARVVDEHARKEEQRGPRCAAARARDETSDQNRNAASVAKKRTSSRCAASSTRSNSAVCGKQNAHA